MSSRPSSAAARSTAVNTFVTLPTRLKSQSATRPPWARTKLLPPRAGRDAGRPATCGVAPAPASASAIASPSPGYLRSREPPCRRPGTRCSSSTWAFCVPGELEPGQRIRNGQLADPGGRGASRVLHDPRCGSTTTFGSWSNRLASGGSAVNTSSPTPAIPSLSSARHRAASSTSAPRGLNFHSRKADGRMSASSSTPIKPPAGGHRCVDAE